MLLPRFLTALVGVPLLILAIWWGQIPFFVLIFGVIMISLYEYFSLAEEAGWPVSKKMGILCGGILVLAIFLFGTQMNWNKTCSLQIFFSPAVLSILMIILIAGALFRRDKESAFMNIAMTWFGIFYVVWTLAHILLIRELRPEGQSYAFFLFLVIWALDIGAYFGGRTFGKNKLSEAISPKKTWEGVAAGSLTAFLTALVCRWGFLKSITIFQALMLAMIIIIFAQLSDLSESLFKRNVNVKDSGNLLPGHGGMLDRFDSFILTAPLYYYAIVILIRP